MFPAGGGDLLAAEIGSAAAVGLRFHPTRGSMDLGASQGGLPPDSVVEDLDTVLAATEAAITRFHDPAYDSMLRVAVAPCSPFSVTGKLMTEAAALARRHGVRLHTHLAETADEESFCQARFGRRPPSTSTRWAGSATTSGWRTPCTSTTPRSPGSRRPAPAWRTARPATPGSAPASRGPATSSTRACPSGSAWTARRPTRRARCSRSCGTRRCSPGPAAGPTALSVREALRLATYGGAQVLGRDAEIGSIEVGKLADLALWRVDTLPHAGIADPVAALALASPPPLELLLVDGRPVVEHDRPGHGRRGRAGPGRGRGVAPAAGPEHADDRPTGTRARTDGGVGTDASRPDGTLKVTGEFAYGSDLWADEMLWGVTLRSPHPSARIRSIDLGPALAVPGVYAVLTADDVPGEKRYGLELDDQPVLATGRRALPG